MAITFEEDDRNKDEIVNDMLSDIANIHDKTVGSFIYEAISPAGSEFVKTNRSITNVKSKFDIRNLSGDELATRIYERTGLTRKPATKATGQVAVSGNGTINIADLFETANGIQFRATETKTITTSGTINVEAVIAGTTGNVPTNQITLFPVTISGFTTVNNDSPTIDGFEAETDADLLKRYFERIQAPSTSGNKAQYKSWAKSITGIGDAKVFSLWNGANTVKVVIIDSNKQPSSAQLVIDVQDYIDPHINGDGEGVAPIGAITTVASATGLIINVNVTVILSSGYTPPQADANITASITQYLKDIAFVENIVSYAKVGAAILDSVGVEDYANLTINGVTSNITIGNEQVAIIGDVTVE